MRWSFIAFALLGLGGCSAASDSPPLGESAEAVVGGVPSTSTQDAVVLINAPTTNGGYSCSGTLVAENLVLTARHCVSALASESGFECAEDGTLIDGPLFTTDTPIAQFAIYTGVGAVMSVFDDTTPSAGVLQVIHEPGSVLCNSDLAFLVLDRALTVPIAPLRMTAPAVGEALTLVGYGLVDNSGVSFVRQQRAQTVLAVGPAVLDAQTNYGLGSSEFNVGEGICSGDSGGPVLSAKGEVVGVVSRGGGGMRNEGEIASNCIGAAVTNTLTDLSNASALVDQAFAAAAAAPKAAATAPSNPGDSAPATPPTPAGTPATDGGGSGGGCAIASPHKTPRGERGVEWITLVAAAALLGTIRRCARRDPRRPSRHRCT